MAHRLHRPNLVGASDLQIALPRRRTTARVSFHRQAREEALARLAPTEKPQVFLNIENVTGTGQHGSYEVYVGVPGAPATEAPLLAGQLSTFGVHLASQPDSPHSGSGITTVLDISQLLAKLKEEHSWDGENLDVTLMPKVVGSAKLSEAPSDLKIGRLSLYYS
jgi:tyrosinase